MRSNSPVGILMALSIYFGMTVPGNADWVQTSGPGTGNAKISAIDVTDSYIVAAHSWRGPLVSRDSGAHWSKIYLWSTVKTMVSGMGKCFANGSEGIMVADTSGSYWYFQNYGQALGDVQCIKIVRNKIFAGTSAKGIYCSKDTGKTWDSTNIGLTNSNVTAIVENGTTLVAQTIGGGVFISIDTGAHWSQSGTAVSNDTVQALLASDGQLFVGAKHNGISVSTDNGLSWKRSNVGLKDSNIQLLVKAGPFLFAGSFSSGIFRSPDSGKTWTPSNNGLKILGASSATVHDSAVYLGLKNGSLLRSADFGTTWSLIGLPFSFVSSLLSSGTSLFATTDWEFIFRSIDSGRTWTHVFAPTFQTNNSANTLFQYGQTLYCGMVSGIFRSIDGGANWSWYNSGMYPYIYTFASLGTRIFAGERYVDGIFYRDPEDTAWYPLESSIKGHGVNLLATIDKYLFAGVYDLGLRRSSDSGKTWVNADSGLDYLPTAYCTLGTEIFIGTGIGVFNSKDNGLHWTQIGLAKKSISTIVAVGSYLVAGGIQGVFLSKDRGANWAKISQGMEGRDTVQCLATHGKDIFAGTYYNGVFRRPISELDTVVVSTLISTPKKDNYFHFEWSNTANPYILLVLSKPEHVTVCLYSLTGRKVTTLAAISLPEGIHRLPWSRNAFPAGCYVVSVKTASGVLKTMMAIKQ